LEAKVLDVNILSIFLVEDHPAHDYVEEVIKRGIEEEFIPVVYEFFPIRCLWIMTNVWGCGRDESVSAIKDLLNIPQVRYVPSKLATLKRAFELAEELDHDVYHCFYLALALQEDASTIISTDRDFKWLCMEVGLKYENPVPDDLIEQFLENRG